MDFTSSGEYWIQVRTEFPPWSWHPFKYHRFVLLKPYLCSNALQATLCCSHSCHSPPLSFSVGLSQNQGVFSRTGGKVGKQHTLFSIETQTTWYQRLKCSLLFFSNRKEFPALLHTKKIVQVVLVAPWTCWNQDVLRPLFYRSVLHFSGTLTPQLGSQWKVPVNVRICLGFCQPNHVIYDILNIKKQSLNWTPIS